MKEGIEITGQGQVDVREDQLVPPTAAPADVAPEVIADDAPDGGKEPTRGPAPQHPDDIPNDPC